MHNRTTINTYGMYVRQYEIEMNGMLTRAHELNVNVHYLKRSILRIQNPKVIVNIGYKTS